MRYITIDQVLYLHDNLIRLYGGSAGVRDHRLLESALARPQMSAFGEDAYPTLELKAAAFFQSLIKNHPFVDGNKRVAYASLHAMLLVNEKDLAATEEEAIRFSLEIASNKLPLETIALWVQKNLIPLKK